MLSKLHDTCVTRRVATMGDY